MAKPRRFVWVLAIVIVITGISAGVWWQARPSAEPAQTTFERLHVAETAGPDSASSMRTSPVVKRDFTVAIRAHGTLQASRDIVVAPKISAPVAAIRADVGDDVHQGDLLLALDRSELQIRLDQTAASLRATESNLARLLAGARADELNQAEAQVQQAEASLKQASDELDRLRALFQSSAVTRAQLDQAETHKKVAEAGLAAASSQLRLVQQGARSEDIDAARAQMEQVQSQVALAELQLTYTDVTAPISGRVISRQVDVGEFAQAGMPAVRVIQLDPIVVRAQLGARDIVKVNRGDAALLTLDALPNETFQGAVSLVESAADPTTRQFGVEVSIPNPQARLLPGMSGDLRIVIASAESAVAAPQEAVISEEDGPYVFVAENGVARKRSVATGISDGAWIEVTSGLDEGELVVVSGHVHLRDGQAINGGRDLP